MADGQFAVRAERVISAPVGEVFAAWIRPESVMRWWGPMGFTCPVAELDVREGGTSLVAMRPPAEANMPDFYNTWSYTRVEENRRLEFVSRFVTASREALTPAEAGIPGDGIPDAVPHVVTFEPLDGSTSRVTVIESGYTAQLARDLSAAGMQQCLDKLAALFPAASQPGGDQEEAR